MLRCRLIRGQYFTLAAKYPEFLVWADLAHHSETEDRFVRLDEQIREQVTLITGAADRVNLGFAHLENVVQEIPSIITSIEPRKSPRVYHGIIPR